MSRYFDIKKVTFNGWIYRQLKAEALGLAGNLDKVWKDVRDSKWLGKTEEGWERFPYFLNGFIPLAYCLKEKDLIDRANKYVEILINSQREDGKIVPINDTDKQNNDIWSLFLVLKVLTIYGQITNDERIKDVLIKSLLFINKEMDVNPLIDWAKSRYFECYIPIIYVKNLTNEYDNLLDELVEKLKIQGLDYVKAREGWKVKADHWDFDTHIVNIAMALKADTLYKYLKKDNDISDVYEMLAFLDKYQGNAYGHFNGDECLAGTSFNQGSELCGIVEAMYSYEVLYELTNDSYFLDRLELVAYNGLFATITTDMWAHQYDQQVNQVACVPLKKKLIYSTNGPESNVFGLEPNYGCCTANFAQGLPLLAMSAYSLDNGKVVINIPFSAKLQLDDNNYLNIESDYPFKREIKLTSTKDINVKLRVYKYCNVKRYKKDENGFINVKLKANEEKEIRLDYILSIQKKKNSFANLYYGPILMALPISYEMNKVEYVRDNVERKYPYCDYTIEPTGDYQYGLISSRFVVVENDFDLPFDRENPALSIITDCVKLKWNINHKYDYILCNKVEKVLKEKETKVLVPYGATYLRIGEIPCYIKEVK